MNRTLYLPIALATVMLDVAAWGVDQVETAQLSIETQVLKQKYPGLQVHAEHGEVRALYGVPMAAGATPVQAAERWLEEERGALGIAGLDLRLLSSEDLDFGEKTVFVYQQFVAGIPVESAGATVVTLNHTPSRVIYVGDGLVQPPASGFAQQQIAGADALALVQAIPDYAKLPQWTVPQTVVLYREWDRLHSEPRRSWKFNGSQADPCELASYTFFVDSSTGELLFVRNEVHEAGSVAVHVDGTYTPGTRPIEVTVPSVRPIPYVRIDDIIINTTCDEASVYTDAAGNAAFQNVVCYDLELFAGLTGRWATVVLPPAYPGSPVSVRGDVGSPGSITLNFDGSSSVADLAQINAYLYVSDAHDFFTWGNSNTGLDLSIVTWVMGGIYCGTSPPAASCNARFCSGPPTLMFSPGANTCANSAYSSVIFHGSRSRLIVMSSSSGASGKAGFCGLDGLISPMIDH